jgi:membrane associated rhomboid family serine protease
MFRLTPIVKNLIIVNVVVFVLQSILAPVTGLMELHNIASPHFRPYQLFTYMFAHGGFGHIFFNMLTFAFTGPLLEDYWGQKKFLVFYIACGLGAAVFNVLMDMFFGIGRFSSMIGASGAVYGIMTAFGIIFANMEMRLLLIPFSFKAKYLIIVLGSLAIINGFSGTNDGTAHMAHLGGIVVAIILIQFWRSTGKG